MPCSWSNLALNRRQCAECRMPGASIPLLQAGQDLVGGNTCELEDEDWPSGTPAGCSTSSGGVEGLGTGEYGRSQRTCLGGGAATSSDCSPLRFKLGLFAKTCCPALADDEDSLGTPAAAASGTIGIASWPWPPPSTAGTDPGTTSDPEPVNKPGQSSSFQAIGYTGLTFLAVNLCKTNSSSNLTNPCTWAPWSIPVCRNAASIDRVSFGDLKRTESGNSANTVEPYKAETGLLSRLPAIVSKGV